MPLRPNDEDRDALRAWLKENPPVKGSPEEQHFKELLAEEKPAKKADE